MRKAVLVPVATGVAAAVLVGGARVLGADGAGFAFLVVWVPMTWLGTISRVVRPRLPARYHELRAGERDGRVYERLGVRIVKRLLRRGPLARFNPDLHLPAEPSPASLAHLEGRMRDAEAAHALLLVATLGVVLHAAARGWWTAALLTLIFDVALNGYPVMLQRYNRALLRRRFAAVLDEGRPAHADPGQGGSSVADTAVVDPATSATGSA
ncbi:MAG: hypothetical protein KDB10_02825 [Acidimicrobiales bacterium]|nr:hypothetical protein [Acidimicrobiales bacterium]MCB9371468.1 hypothetical protein [Microthrixaceae bacterium]